MDIPDPIPATHELARKDGAAPHLYDLVDRSQFDMPPYCSSAPAVLVVAKDTLAAIRRLRGSSRPLKWTPGVLFDGCKTRTADAFLCVQRCGPYWSVGRVITSSTGSEVEQILCCAFNYLPYCARTRAAAMRLAEHCHPLPQLVAASWKPIC